MPDSTKRPTYRDIKEARTRGVKPRVPDHWVQFCVRMDPELLQEFAAAQKERGLMQWEAVCDALESWIEQTKRSKAK
jgi:hypothetical protein